jgi:nicotinate-nucleotide adenylyltransferase
MNTRIALYGGSFDPIHLGHLIASRSIAEQLHLSKVVLIPARQSPLKTNRAVSEPEHRLAMARLAVEGDPFFEVSDAEVHRPGPSFTIDTVTSFRQTLPPDADLFWIIGADSLPELPSWRRVADLVRLVQIVTAARPGWSPPPRDDLAAMIGPIAAQSLLDHCCRTPQIDISSSDIRNRVRAGLPIRYLVPDGVASYIASHKLYMR